ncbi:acyl carrier protein [Spirillospora sp. CA-253888]
MSAESVLEAVQQTLSETFEVGRDEVALDALLSTLPRMDSRRLLVMLLDFEERYGVEIPLDQVVRMATVAELAELATTVINGGQAAATPA